MSDEEKVRYKFFLGSGAREQEVSFASWSDLDLHKGVFTVRAKPEEGFTPKTHESRSIPLPANLVSAIFTCFAQLRMPPVLQVSSHGK